MLVGGPGQGKTTVGQLLCQLCRANLIEDLHAVGPQASTVVTAMQPHLQGGTLPALKNRRWPLRLDLSAYADVLGGSPETSILRHLASRISDRGTDTITAPQLKSWLGSWPWLLVLDGFDEVVAPQVPPATAPPTTISAIIVLSMFPPVTDDLMSSVVGPDTGEPASLV